MAEQEVRISYQPPTVESGQQQELITNFRNYLSERGKHFGDITGDRYDRETYAPIVASFVYDNLADVKTPGGPEEPDITLPAVQRRLPTFHKIMREKPALHAISKSKYLKIAEEHTEQYPSIRMTQQLRAALQPYELVGVVTDVLAVLGAEARSIDRHLAA